MLLTLASIKGSPGVTTLALALAARWPGDARAVLVECDPVGGDIAARFGLTLSPGLISLAAAARRASDLGVIWEHTQPLPGGLAAIVGPLRPDQAGTALRTLAAADGSGGVLAAAAGRPDVTVIADCGRLDADSSALPVIAAADQMLLVVRPLRDELAHVAARLEEISHYAHRVGLLLAGIGYSSTEVAAELGLPVLAMVPRDARTAARLAGKPVRPAWARRRLPRAAASIASAVASTLASDRTTGSGDRAADDPAADCDVQVAAARSAQAPAGLAGSLNGHGR